jgi:hypothetical protein
VGGALEWVVSKPAGVVGVVYDAEVGDDLFGWNRVERTILQTDDALFRARDDVSGAARRFMRGTVHPVK